MNIPIYLTPSFYRSCKIGNLDNVCCFFYSYRKYSDFHKVMVQGYRVANQKKQKHIVDYLIKNYFEPNNRMADLKTQNKKTIFEIEQEIENEIRKEPQQKERELQQKERELQQKERELQQKEKEQKEKEREQKLKVRIVKKNNSKIKLLDIWID